MVRLPPSTSGPHNSPLQSLHIPRARFSDNPMLQAAGQWAQALATLGDARPHIWVQNFQVWGCGIESRDWDLGFKV